MTPDQRQEFKNKSTFVDHVNDKFQQVLAQHNIQNWRDLWQDRKHKNVDFNQGNLVDWILENKSILTNDDSIWCSNITEYRWTLLNTSWQKLKEFENFIRESQIPVL